MKLAPSGLGLSAKLTLVLLAFGVIPLALSIAVGYTVSRAIIVDGSESALRELTERQAAHLTTELTRQRLLLRTITGQLPQSAELLAGSTEESTLSLAQSLPQDGVFDGLRIVAEDGRILTSVGLRPKAPYWPEEAPATDWSLKRTRLHREGRHVVAYLLAAPIGPNASGLWLEGHVPAEDFTRLFALPEHMAGAIEPAVFGPNGFPVVVGHSHAAAGLTEAFALSRHDALAVVRAEVEGRPAVVATTPISGSDWYFIAALPLEIALAPLARLRDAALLSTGVLVLLILVIGVLAARSVTTPLRELAGAAMHFGRRGSYSRLEPRSTDEVGFLVSAFNRMAEDLEHTRSEVERLHAREMERAQQLASVGELASGVAHEIRNPVTGVRGALELVLRKLTADDPSRPLLEEADRQLGRIETTTNQLLHYARPPELREVVVDANRLVDQTVQVVGAHAKNADIELVAALCAEPAPVRVDPELMVQVLVNLTLNGIDAIRTRGRLSLWVRQNGDTIAIAVQDTGPGIPPEHRNLIFRPFFTTKHQGTGLGLSISHQIVTRHGGRLVIEEAPGGGAVFVVELPLANTEAHGEH